MLAPEDSPYEVLEKRRSPCPHVHRFHARERETGKEVELRVSRPQAEEAWLVPFSRELRDLTLLDHPAFLPVLDKGVVGGRGYYTVPLRTNPHLGQVVENEDLGPQQRFGVISYLAGALAHAHEKGVLLGFLNPSFVALGREQGLPYLLHHHCSPDAISEERRDRLPEDCLPEAEPTVAANLFLWARLSYWLLSKGAFPYPDGGQGKRLPVRKLDPSMPGELAEAVDACLEWSPDARPDDAREVHGAICEVSGSHRFEFEDLPSGDEDGDELPSFLAIDVAEIRRGAVPDPGSLSLDGSARPLESGEVPLPPPEGGGGVAKVFGAAFLVLGGLAVGLAIGEGPAEAPPAPPAPRRAAEKKPLKPRPEVEEVTEDDAARVLAKPRVRSFLEGRETNEENFRGRWRNLLRLAARKRIPGDAGDTERIAQLRDLFQEDPRRACEELDFYRRSLSRAVSYDEWKKKQEKAPSS